MIFSQNCMFLLERFHQDTYSPPNDYFKDIPELPDHHDGDHHDWEHSQVVVLDSRVPKTYNMLGINLKNPIKTPILLQMTTSRTFLSFLIIMMVIIMTGNTLKL